MARGLYKCRIIKRDRDILYSIIRTALEPINITIKKVQSMEINSIEVKCPSKFSDFGELEYLDIYDGKIEAALSSSSTCSSCNHLLLIPIAYIDKEFSYKDLNEVVQIKNLLRAIANNYQDFIDIKCERC